MGTYDTRGGAALHDPAADNEGPCEVCGFAVDDCKCPECPKCRTAGDPNCYKNHGLNRYRRIFRFLADGLKRHAKRSPPAHSGGQS